MISTFTSDFSSKFPSFYPPPFPQVVVNLHVLSANIFDFGFISFHKFSNFNPPPPTSAFLPPEGLQADLSRHGVVVADYRVPREEYGYLPVFNKGGGFLFKRARHTYPHTQTQEREREREREREKERELDKQTHSPAPSTGVMGCGAAEATGMGFVCFVVINSFVLSAAFFFFINILILLPSANRVDLGFFVSWIFNVLTPPPPNPFHPSRRLQVAHCWTNKNVRTC